MTIYFQAFRREGEQIFGNLDGQAIFHGSIYEYRKGTVFERLKAGKGRPKFERVKFWRVAYPMGAGKDVELEIIPNPHWQGEAS